MVLGHDAGIVEKIYSKINIIFPLLWSAFCSIPNKSKLLLLHTCMNRIIMTSYVYIFHVMH